MAKGISAEDVRKADEILASEKSDDLKLYEIFQIYKSELRNNYTNLYYALLGWKDSHLKEIKDEESLYK